MRDITLLENKGFGKAGMRLTVTEGQAEAYVKRGIAEYAKPIKVKKAEKVIETKQALEEGKSDV